MLIRNKKLEKVYQNKFKTAENVFQQIGKDGSHVFIRLFKEHFGNVKSNLNRRRKLQIVSYVYVSGLRAPSLASVEETDCFSIEDTGRQYFQWAVPTISYYGSSNNRFESVMISAEQPSAGAARECTQSKISVWFRRILAFVQGCNDHGEGMSCSFHNRRACPVCYHDLSSELCFVQ